MVEATSVGFKDVRLVAVDVEADAVRLLAKSTPAKAALPSHIRVDEGISKKMSTFHWLTRLVDGFGQKV